MSSVLDDVLVGSPDVAVLPERPWPPVKVDGLVVCGVGRGDGGLVVNGYEVGNGARAAGRAPATSVLPDEIASP